jgi:hypothetical protein
LLSHDHQIFWSLVHRDNFSFHDHTDLLTRRVTNLVESMVDAGAARTCSESSKTPLKIQQRLVHF